MVVVVSVVSIETSSFIWISRPFRNQVISGLGKPSYLASNSRVPPCGIFSLASGFAIVPKSGSSSGTFSLDLSFGAGTVSSGFLDSSLSFDGIGFNLTSSGCCSGRGLRFPLGHCFSSTGSLTSGLISSSVSSLLSSDTTSMSGFSGVSSSGFCGFFFPRSQAVALGSWNLLSSRKTSAASSRGIGFSLTSSILSCIGSGIDRDLTFRFLSSSCSSKILTSVLFQFCLLSLVLVGLLMYALFYLVPTEAVSNLQAVRLVALTQLAYLYEVVTYVVPDRLFVGIADIVALVRTFLLSTLTDGRRHFMRHGKENEASI
uniref:Uncharacterized protein n=1 Tax=Glossina brevipalpis TaxID=37001 RepID=A0A1A9W7E7_9MUSC